jgi:hypothetical protein
VFDIEQTACVSRDENRGRYFLADALRDAQVLILTAVLP